MPFENLKNISDHVLQAELARRQKIKYLPPTPLANPNFDKVKELAKRIVDHTDKHGYEMKDEKHWAFEALMEAVYGSKIWDWRSKKLN